MTAPSGSALVLAEVADGVLSLTLNRPEARNAFGPAMRDELMSALAGAEDDGGIGAILLSGAGKGFCAGGDTKAMARVTPVEKQQSLRRTGELIRAMQQSSKPIVTAVHGFAVGAGFSLVLASDFVVVEEGTLLRGGFMQLGLIPDMGAHLLLTELLGVHRAKRLIWTDEPLDLDTAVRSGLVPDVVPRGQGLATARSLAERLAAGPRTAIAMSKSIFATLQADRLTSVLAQESSLSALLRTTDEFAARLAARSAPTSD